MILPTPIPKRLIQQLQQSMPRRIASQLSQHMIALSDTSILSVQWQQQTSALRQIYPPLFLHIGYLIGIHARDSQESPLQVLQNVATRWHTDAEHMVLEIVEGDVYRLSWYWQGKDRRELNSIECELLASQCTTICRPFFHGHLNQLAFDFPVTQPEYIRYFDNYIIGHQQFEQTEFAIYLPHHAVQGNTFNGFYASHHPLENLKGLMVAENNPRQADTQSQSQLPLPALFAYDQTVNLILGNLKQVPTLAALAQTQSISERTLKRRLRAANCHYQQLLTHIRFHHTLIWLHENNDSISAIADRLGYASVANFSKAFRQWCGVSPSSARSQLLQSDSIDSISKFHPSLSQPPLYW